MRNLVGSLSTFYLAQSARTAQQKKDRAETLSSIKKRLWMRTSYRQGAADRVSVVRVRVVGVLCIIGR
jgi:hypothetical protein